MTRLFSAALPIAYVSLRILIVANWLVGAATVTLLVAAPTRRWIMSSLELAPSPQADRVVFGLRAIAVVGLLMIPLYHVVFTRLLAMVRTARAGDPFVAANAERLRWIGWALVGLQLGGLIVALIVRAISRPDYPVNIHAGVSVAGCLAILLAFILAQVFAEGARMRDDLAGTV